MRVLALMTTMSSIHIMTVGKLQLRDIMPIFQGIIEADDQTENAIKHWINATNKANNAKDQTVASIYDNRFCIPLDFEILESSLPLYQYGLGSRLTYESTFADYSDVIKANKPDVTYTISNISLEFNTIINASLASQIRTEYMKSSILYDRILTAHIGLVPPCSILLLHIHHVNLEEIYVQNRSEQYTCLDDYCRIVPLHQSQRLGSYAGLYIHQLNLEEIYSCRSVYSSAKSGGGIFQNRSEQYACLDDCCRIVAKHQFQSLGSYAGLYIHQLNLEEIFSKQV